MSGHPSKLRPRVARRHFLKASVGAGAGALVLRSGVLARGQSPNEKLDVACIGVGGRGAANVNGIAGAGENIVALCDVDDKRAGGMYDRFPNAKKYYDYRRLLDEMANSIDAVVVSTPDHTHAHPALAAMLLGKHLYCEKPMAHNVYQVRQMTDTARRMKLATQLGAQRHAMSNMHRVVELVESGAIGEVRECHAWIGGDRGMPSVPDEYPPVPEWLKWDLWIGPAPYRPYSPAFAPYNWRFWWDYGTGETGNWGCHILDIPYWALKLGHCTRVSAEGPPPDPERTPKAMHVTYQFPARGELPELQLHWYHSKDGPPILEEHGLPHYGTGVLFVGSEGMLLTEFGKHELFPKEKFEGFEYPEPFIPDSPGFYKEWTAACKGGEPATVNFDYSGPMAETVLLGNVAYRVGKPFAWDAENLTALDCPEAEELLNEPCREGWPLPG